MSMLMAHLFVDLYFTNARVSAGLSLRLTNCCLFNVRIRATALGQVEGACTSAVVPTGTKWGSTHSAHSVFGTMALLALMRNGLQAPK